MLTTMNFIRHCAFAAIAVSMALLAGCSARPVLHEFPLGMAPGDRPEAAVAYTLREQEPGSDRWELRGEQGGDVGDFRWKRAFRAVQGGNAADRSEDFRRDDLFQNSIDSTDYIFRLSATSGSLKRSTLTGTAPPRVTVFNAATGQRVGELELRIGYDVRFEGDWNGRQVFWRAEVAQGMELERDTDDGAVLDTYPAAQLLQWVGGSTAGLMVFGGREVSGEPPAFAAPVFDVQSGRALTHRELADAMTMLFGIRAAQEAAVLVNAAPGDD